MSFLKASEARNTAVNQTTIFTEVQLIEKAIVTAAAAGYLKAVVGPESSPAVTTGMTNSSTFFYAYTDPSNYRTDAHINARKQMDDVINNFQLLGYVVRRERIDDTTTFNWVVTW